MAAGHDAAICCLQGQLPDYNEPVIIPRQLATVEDFCNRIHKVQSLSLTASSVSQLLSCGARAGRCQSESARSHTRSNTLQRTDMGRLITF